MEMIRTCTVCNKQFDYAPYYMREGNRYYAVCSVKCLHESGEKLYNE